MFSNNSITIPSKLSFTVCFQMWLERIYSKFHVQNQHSYNFSNKTYFAKKSLSIDKFVGKYSAFWVCLSHYPRYRLLLICLVRDILQLYLCYFDRAPKLADQQSTLLMLTEGPWRWCLHTVHLEKNITVQIEDSLEDIEQGSMLDT